MAVASVKLETEAFMVCLTHALSTEREEVMGLLIGEIEEENVVHVYSCIMLQRLDKRKDRVEISPEQLSDASTQAERLGMLTPRQRPMRVVGWYHSHPHITVWPSHVDLRTQALYQVMDAGFIGLIFSCFNHDDAHKGQFKVICFQSEKSIGGSADYQRVEIELQLASSSAYSEATIDRLTELPQILAKEEEEAYKATLRCTDLLASLHNSAVFTKALCQLMEVICGPQLQSFENRLELNKLRAARLQKEKEDLEKELDSIQKPDMIMDG